MVIPKGETAIIMHPGTDMTLHADCMKCHELVVLNQTTEHWNSINIMEQSWQWIFPKQLKCKVPWLQTSKFKSELDLRFILTSSDYNNSFLLILLFVNKMQVIETLRDHLNLCTKNPRLFDGVKKVMYDYTQIQGQPISLLLRSHLQHLLCCKRIFSLSF